MPRLPSLNETRTLFSMTLSRFPVYRAGRTLINRVRGPRWESQILAHRNRIRVLAQQRGLAYQQTQASARIRQRVAPKKITPKAQGQLRIYTAFNTGGWVGESLSASLNRFGAVRHFEFASPAPNDLYAWFRQHRAAMNQRLYQDVADWHAQAPVAIFLTYGSGYQLDVQTIHAINRLGIATLNLGLDDMSGLAKWQIDGIAADVAGIATAFDVCYTSTLAACEEYLLLDANPYYLPVGGEPTLYRRLDLPRDIPIAFFGFRHDIRAALVNALNDRGLSVQAFGKGWDSGYLSAEKIVELINRTEIVLGHGHHASWGNSAEVRVTCLKGRDFEIPMCGALYLTTFDPELQLWFDIGKEIVCYRTIDDLYDTVRFLLNHPTRMAEIRQAAWERCHQQHTWEQRWQEIFRVLGILA